jgi:hypothetical protein
VADEPNTTPSADPATPDTGAAAEPVVNETTSTTPSSVEEVEAQWRNRMSQLDKAHNAEVEALRRTLADREAAEAKRRGELEQVRLAGLSEAERVAAERDQYKTLLEQERVGRVIDTRKARYPAAAQNLGDDVLAQMDEGRLAALETRLAGQTVNPPSLIDPNSAVRNTTPSAPAGDGSRTSDELKADLAKYGPEFAREIANR